jgi:hypothetical protein
MMNGGEYLPPILSIGLILPYKAYWLEGVPLILPLPSTGLTG